MSKHLTPEEVRQREEAIAQLRAAGMTVPEIAAHEQCPATVVYSVLRQPNVKALVTEHRAASLNPMLTTALSEVEKSVKALADIRDSEAKPGERANAAAKLLKWFLEVHQLVEVMPRLAAIEASLAAIVKPKADDTFHPRPVLTVADVPPGLTADDMETV